LEEEIPRWLGVSLVCAYVLGLGAVAYTAITSTQREMQEQTDRSIHVAVALLSGQLARVDREDAAALQRDLRAFAQQMHCEQLRVIDTTDSIVASILLTEVGRPRPVDLNAGSLRPSKVEVNGLTDTPSGDARWLFRAPVGAATADAWLVEGVTVNRRTITAGSLVGTWTFTAILLAVGVMWVVYRQLRRHFRGVAHIAENLMSHRDALTRDFTVLRVADELGAVATAWNQLIDLAEQFRSEAQRSTASSELKAVLERSAGGELADALQAVPDGLMVLSEGDRIAYANQLIVRLIGDSREGGLVGVNLSDVAAAPLGKKIIEVARKTRDPSGSAPIGNEIIHSDDDESSYRVRVGLAHGHRPRGACVVMVSDISQQLRADKAREEFVSQVTHELRTPLTNIRAYAETLSSGMFEDPKVVTECYNVITKETRRLSRLIEDILSLSQLEVGTMQMLMDDVDLHRLLTEAVQDVRGLADEKSIDLQMSLPAKLPTLRADRDKLAVVLNNLLGNAIKYTPEKGEVHVGCKITDRAAVITVKDSGIGIDPSEHERIFERFQRSADPDVLSETGTGIGLTTAREIVHHHGGDVEVISRKGEGATFVVRLPCDTSAITNAVAAAAGA
jgi:two-component system phosphate regulon sensor histidine kinase PhoR